MSTGDIRLGDTIDVQFGTSVNGVPTTLAGSPAVAAYVGNGTTELTAGITLSVDFDTRTGLHNVRVVATSGNGYAAGSDINLVLTAGTVGGSSVANTPVGAFSIEKRSALMPTTAGRTLDVSAGGEAGLDWANIGSPTTAQNLSATNIDVDQIVASVSGAVGSVTGAVGSVTGNVGGNVPGSVGSVVGAVGSVTGLTPATVHSDLDDIQARLPAALTSGGRMKASVEAILDTAFTEGASGRIAAAFKQFFNIATPAATMDHGILVDTVTTLTNAPPDSAGVATLLSRLSALRAGYLDNLSAGAAALESSLQGLITTVGAAGAGLTATASAVWSVATRLLTAGTNIVLAKGVGVTGFNDLSAAQVNTEADTALADYDGPTHAELVSEINDVQADIAALTIPTAAAVADAVWEEAVADHSGTVGSTAEALAAAGSVGDPWTTALPGAYGAGTAGKIVGDNLNATVSSRATQTSVDDIPTNAELATALAAADDATLAAIAALNDLSAADAADAVWEEAIADHSGTVGSTAEALAAAGAAGDPWITALPGAYGAGTAGKIVGDNINATISSRSSHSAADVWAVGTRTLTSFGTLVADVATAVWGAATRILTAGTNIVLAKGTGVTGFNDPTVGAIADQVWDEAIAGHALAGSTGEALADAATGGSAPTAVEIADEVETRALHLTAAERNAIADALLDRANSIETGVTLRQAQRLELAALAGKISGAGGTLVTIRNAVADSKDRIVATVDVNGDRTAITTDMT
jgi:hypothetical protein